MSKMDTFFEYGACVHLTEHMRRMTMRQVHEVSAFLCRVWHE